MLVLNAAQASKQETIPLSSVVSIAFIIDRA